MTQYIDKSVLVAEIKRRRDGIKKGIFSIPLTGSDRVFATFEYEILGKVKDFLDTLEVKRVDSNDTFIAKAVSYLNSKLYDWVRIEHPNPSVSSELIIKQDFIEDFRNYMKGE